MSTKFRWSLPGNVNIHILLWSGGWTQKWLENHYLSTYTIWTFIMLPITYNYQLPTLYTGRIEYLFPSFRYCRSSRLGTPRASISVKHYLFMPNKPIKKAVILIVFNVKSMFVLSKWQIKKARLGDFKPHIYPQIHVFAQLLVSSFTAFWMNMLQTRSFMNFVHEKEHCFKFIVSWVKRIWNK